MVNVLVTTTMHEAAVEVLKSGRVTQRSKATANSTDDSSAKKSEKTARDAGQRGSAAGADEEEEVLVRIGNAEWSGGGEECISLSALRTLSRLAKVPLHRLLERSEIVEKAPVKPPRVSMWFCGVSLVTDPLVFVCHTHRILNLLRVSNVCRWNKRTASTRKWWVTSLG